MTLNTKTFHELETAFDAVVKAHQATAHVGFRNGSIHLEDGLPWVEVEGPFENKVQAKTFCQEVANALNVRVLFNRLECYSEGNVVCAVLDFMPRDVDPTLPIPAYSSDADAREFMDDYGTEFLPQVEKKSTLKM